MPDSGKTGKPEESGTRADSVVIVADDKQSLSYASCRTCPGPRRTPTLHVRCTPVDTIQGAGKDTDAEIDNKGKSLACSYLPCKFQRQLSLEDQSENEGSAVIDREVIDVASDQHIAQVVFAAESSHPGPITPVLKSKRKAEADTEDGPVSPAKKNQKPDKAADDKAAYEQFWEHHDPTIFGDSPDQPESSYGRGLCMQIQLESLHLDVTHDPMDIPTDVIQPQIVTFFIAGFGLDTANTGDGRMLTSSMDELHQSDPEGVGLEGLDLLHKLPGANADEPNSMNDQEQF